MTPTPRVSDRTLVLWATCRPRGPGRCLEPAPFPFCPILYLGIRSWLREASLVSVVISTAMTCGGHLGRAADGRDWVTSNSRASRASRNLLVCPTVHRRSQDTERYSPTAQAWVGTEPQPSAGTPVREWGGGTAAGLTTEASIAPLLWTLLALPTNSSSSLASSTTRDGCSAHRARNCELSTLHGEVTAGPQPPPGPQTVVPLPQPEPGGEGGSL